LLKGREEGVGDPVKGIWVEHHPHSSDPTSLHSTKYDTIAIGTSLTEFFLPGTPQLLSTETKILIKVKCPSSAPEPDPD
jgi:hypothetical protein